MTHSTHPTHPTYVYDTDTVVSYSIDKTVAKLYKSHDVPKKAPLLSLYTNLCTLPSSLNLESMFQTEEEGIQQYPEEGIQQYPEEGIQQYPEEGIQQYPTVSLAIAAACEDVQGYIAAEVVELDSLKYYVNQVNQETEEFMIEFDTRAGRHFTYRVQKNEVGRK